MIQKKGGFSATKDKPTQPVARKEPIITFLGNNNTLWHLHKAGVPKQMMDLVQHQKGLLLPYPIPPPQKKADTWPILIVL